MNNTPLQPHQQRVVDECTELHEKTTALGLFFGSKIFLSLPIEEQKRLNKQWQIMQQYVLILTERIAAFPSVNNITSPRTDDQGIEQLIVDLKATAPRITPEDLAANIIDVEYVKHISKGGQVLRWAVITTKNGYAVVGNPSVSVSPENDREMIGELVALENSKNQLWPLMGYELKSKLTSS